MTSVRLSSLMKIVQRFINSAVMHDSLFITSEQLLDHHVAMTQWVD